MLAKYPNHTTWEPTGPEIRGLGLLLHLLSLVLARSSRRTPKVAMSPRLRLRQTCSKRMQRDLQLSICQVFKVFGSCASCWFLPQKVRTRSCTQLTNDLKLEDKFPSSGLCPQGCAHTISLSLILHSKLFLVHFFFSLKN